MSDEIDVLILAMADSFYQLGRHEMAATEPGSIEAANAAKKALSGRIATLEKELAAAQKDAERYRQLRNKVDTAIAAAIDNAMKGSSNAE